MSSIKTILLPPPPSSSKKTTTISGLVDTTKNTALEYEKTKRVITSTASWDVLSQYLDASSQLHCIKTLLINQSPEIEYIKQQIHYKRNGYRQQDTIKHLYDETAFISWIQIVDLLVKSELQCFYCHDPVVLIYENVRHPKQWSLDRIDNSLGHNTNNVEIACLSCNLRRKTIHHEKYITTKQMKTIVKLHDNPEPI